MTRVLIVDDDAVDRKAVRRALGASGLQLELQEAEDAEAALNALGDQAPGVILLDLRLPGLDGLAFLSRLRRLDVDAPVIVLTDHGDDQTAVEIMKAGAADYIPKAALTPERLARSIGQAVRVRRAEREADEARRQLEAAERRYRFLAESIPQLVWIVNDDLVVEYLNEKGLVYFGPELGRQSDPRNTQMVHPDDLPLMRARWAEAIKQGTRLEAQVRLRRHDGVYRWHLHRGDPFIDPSDQRRRWFGTSTDIEEQKQAETRAEAANRTKDEFLAMLSHELRSPLNAILGWLGVLRLGGATPDKQARALEIIERNARAQTQIIEDLLDISRIVAGKLRIEQAPRDLRPVIAEALEAVRPQAEARGVAVEAPLPHEPLPVLGDAARLQQIFWNLLSNAIKFTPHGGRVAVDALRQSDHIVVAVRDTGQGIAADFLPHVFERFRQADGSTTRRQGGLGLGLSISKHLVELHGGTIEATSEGPGHGATFTVWLPAHLALPPPGPPPSPPRASLRGVRVMLVDDDQDALEMMVLALEQQGALVRPVGSADEARAALDDDLPDLVVSDIGMPGEDGYALLRALRARPPERGGQLPAIALTGYAGTDAQRRAREAGFDRHLSKPVDLTELIDAVTRILLQHNRQTAPQNDAR